MTILPNPWICKCLQQFVIESNKLYIKVNQHALPSAEERTNTPVCVVSDVECDSNVVHVNIVHQEYFQRIRYSKLMSYELVWTSFSYDEDESEYESVTFKDGGTAIGPAK
ncbi:hypothetical protein QE152_g6228 [Popillia japonica]|uniref:Uncharacterized protein n=1 Tax=Popillia japonica TaxID=7064 RepID=A0AAW1MFP4_POPJA